MATINPKKKSAVSSRGAVSVGGNKKVDDKAKAKYTPTAKEKQNIKDATQMKNMRPVMECGGKMKKAQKGITVGKLKKVSDSLNTVGNQKVNAGVQRTVKSGYDSTSKELVRSGKKDISNATRYNSIIKKKKS